MHEKDLLHSKTVENCLNMSGFINVWQLQENSPLNIAKSVKLKLKDSLKYKWLELVF